MSALHSVLKAILMCAGGIGLLSKKLQLQFVGSSVLATSVLKMFENVLNCRTSVVVCFLF